MKRSCTSNLLIFVAPVFALVVSGCIKQESDVENMVLGANPSLKTGLVIRAGQCSATAFKNGSGVHVSSDGDTISGLSVNCTTNTSNKSVYSNYLTGIGGYSQYCVSTVAGLNGVGAKVVKDPIKGNSEHCLLSGKASKIAGKLTKYP
ncbi:hypothetical protein L4D06_03120 [Enterovibrio makurazakiensis]|uniref:Lipoprotein n=1 Tax=Enterovibrio gelatinilyticus TaxID=2899819 RepID=A0ABT5R4U5_9GAMM|nr:hypothetical protein [Enterovibrio sp. ZSDZ42]MDD1794532.1 hypothetical protein [Enterovibrio sp. ZSDZ42]